MSNVTLIDKKDHPTACLAAEVGRPIDTKSLKETPVHAQSTTLRNESLSTAAVAPIAERQRIGVLRTQALAEVKVRFVRGELSDEQTWSEIGAIFDEWPLPPKTAEDLRVIREHLAEHLATLPAAVTTEVTR